MKQLIYLTPYALAILNGMYILNAFFLWDPFWVVNIAWGEATRAGLFLAIILAYIFAKMWRIHAHES